MTPLGTTTYRVSSVSDKYGCAGTVAGSGFAVTVVPPPPTAVSAAAVTPTRVDLVWNFSGTADSYDIERRAAGAYAKVGSSTTRSYSDTTAAANTAYLYRVRAVKSGTSSEPSGPDLATTVIFADDPLVSGQTPIRAQHILDLRTAVNAVRTTAGLAQSSFTDASLAGVNAKTAHIQELRSALDGARSQLLLAPLSYTDQPLANGLFIKRVHVDQVRGGVK